MKANKHIPQAMASSTFALVASLMLVLVGCRATQMQRAMDRQVTYEERKPVQEQRDDEFHAIAASDDDATTPVSVLMINGDRIAVDDVLGPIRESLVERSRVMPPEQYQALLREVVEGRVRVLARDALLYQEAAARMTEAELKAVGHFADDRIQERVNKEFAGRQTRFEQALEREGSSLEAERERMRREVVLMHWLRNDLTKRIANPTREELWAVFQSSKESLRKPPRRDMRLIELSVLKRLPEGAAAPSRDEMEAARRLTREEALAIRTRFESGEDFAELAKAHSDGLQAGNGGHWGWVTRDGLREKWTPVVEALFAMDQPGVTDVIETADACFIARCEQVDPGQEPDFEAMQPQLIENFRDARFAELVEQRVEELQAEAHIRPKRIDRFLRAVIAAAPSPTPSLTP